MQALHIIGDEHQSLAAILHAVRFMLKEIAAGQLQADVPLFRAMVHYLEAYAEQRHHPKEDLIFHRVAQRTSDGADVLAELGRQHAAAPERIAVLQQALATFVADPSLIGPFADAFYQYADFYRGHMMLEEDVLLPLARKHLTPEDWAEIDRQFEEEMARNRLDAESQEDFRTLFTKLVESAPEPIGLGARPYKG